MKTKLNYPAVMVVMLLILSTGSTLGFSGKDQIKFKGGLLSVKVERIQLSELLLNLENATEVRFELDEAAGKREISADFSEVPLLEGIEKIIHPLSYAVVYGRDKEIDTVIILPEGKDQITPARVEPNESSPGELNPPESPEANLGSKNPSVDTSEDDKTRSQGDYVPSTGPPGYEKHTDEGPPGAHDKFAEEPPGLKPPTPPPPLEPPPGSSPTNDVKGPPGYEEQLYEGPPNSQSTPPPPPGS